MTQAPKNLLDLPKAGLQHDGTSQAGRALPALNPASALIDERTVADLLRFAQGFASELTYFNEHNLPDGDWSGMLNADPDALARTLESQTPANLQPHVALLLTFLQLLQSARTQLNTLTRKHLEFYYHEALRLTANPPVADHVHVLVDLAAGQDQLLLPAGTLLTAGQDSQGVDLHYRTNYEIYINRARVASLKSLYVQKQLIGIREAHQKPDLVVELFPEASKPWQALERNAQAFMAMLCLVLGDANPGGALPAYPGINQPLHMVLADLDLLVSFIQSNLALSLPAFRTLMELKQQQDTAEPIWRRINAILESAGKRRDASFVLDISAPRNFEQNLLAALGLRDFKTFFNTLPEVADIYDLYRLRDRDEVRDFIERDQRLSMSIKDFTEMMSLVDDSYRVWRRIYDILRTAARRKTTGKQFVSPNLRSYDANKFGSLVEQTLGQLTFPAIVGQPTSLDNCYQQLLLLEAYFHMSIEDFATLRSVHHQGTAAKPWEWDQAYTILQEAYAARVASVRREQLRTTHQVSFDALIRLVFGDSLPDSSSFLKLDADNDQQYIREQLYLEKANFNYIKSVHSRPLNDPAWKFVYTMLELAERRKHGGAEAHAQIERRQNIYAAADASLVQVRTGVPGGPATPRWRTFGTNPTKAPANTVVPATLGFAITSPLLALAEGDRTITLTLISQADRFDQGAIQALLKSSPTAPLRFFLSTPDGMLEVTTATITAEVVAATQGLAGFGVLRMRILLSPQLPAIVPLAGAASINTPWPILQIQLADVADAHELYRALQSLALQRVDLKVEVSGLTQLTLQNDDGILDPKKPFEPFGLAPVAGSSFTIAHPEICTKKLDTLSMQIEWLGAPDSFHEHYQGYAGYQNPQPDPASPFVDNTAFQGQLRLYDRRAFFDIQPIQLFHADSSKPTTGAAKPHSVTIDSNLKQQSGYQQDLQLAMATEALNWSRYWQLELRDPDFRHSVYPRAATGYANRRSGGAANPFLVNLPYTPKIKRLLLGYSATEQIDLFPGSTSMAGRLYQIEPFGYRELAPEADKRYSFLPHYTNEGELYIGIQDLVPPQRLALLFQLAEGSADPDVARTPVSLSYLDGNSWNSLEQGRILTDTTNGLLNTGIITFDLPPVAPGTRMPGMFYWLRLAISRNSAGIADLVAIEAQAVSATFVDQGNTLEHLSQPLAPQRISGLAQPLAQVRAIRQPYSSFGGKPAEQPAHFYTRVSERLRHKNRVLTSWDYERMILKAFPAIYKVKCLPAGTSADPRQADQIRIIVIPDIRGKLPFDPFEPKVAADTLVQITRHLNQHCSPLARFVVSNPTYIRLHVRLGVRLRPAFDPGYYLAALDQALQRFLAPWAYDQSADIVFGGRINASLIVNFVEQRPYVDYVAGIKLYVDMDEQADPQEVTQQFVVPADAILVSDQRHQINLISSEVYQEAYFTGIGAMQIEFDFRVG